MNFNLVNVSHPSYVIVEWVNQISFDFSLWLIGKCYAQI